MPCDVHQRLQTPERSGVLGISIQNILISSFRIALVECSFFRWSLRFKKNNDRTGISFALGGGQLFSPGVGFCREKNSKHHSNGLLIKDLKSWDNLQQCLGCFFRDQFSNKIYLASKLVKKHKIGRKFWSLGSASTAVLRPMLIDKRSTFLKKPTHWGSFCWEKISKNSGWDGQNFRSSSKPKTCEITGTQVFYPNKTPNNKIKQYKTRLELN